MTSPIRPEEVAKGKLDTIPSEVIEAFNEEIVRKYHAGSATVAQDAVVERIVGKFPPAMAPAIRQRIFDERWLDVESIYREAGWRVTYDKPGFNESYEPTFEFKVTAKTQ